MSSSDAVSGPPRYNVRVVDTPRHKEVWMYSKTHVKSETQRLRKPVRKFEDLDEFEQLRSRVRREKYYKDRLQKLRRLIDCNYTTGENVAGVKVMSKFLTLTYADGSKTDASECWSDFRDFIARLRYHLETKRGYPEEIQYLAVWEIQKKRGVKHGDFAVHWHVLLFNTPYLDQYRLQKVWGLGIVDIRAIKNPKAAGDYVSKYVGKAMAENSRAKQKAYRCSKGLKRPGEFVAELTAEELACVVDGAGDFLHDYEYGTPLGETVRYLSMPK
jgi:hypothetical protein